MRDLTRPGCLARSLAGRDKGALFVIIGESTEYVMLADGRHRTVENPKKKKRKHIQPIGYADRVIKERLEAERPVTNEAIKYVIRTYEEGVRASRPGSVSKRRDVCQRQM